jgi:hypothetical protein
MISTSGQLDRGRRLRIVAPSLPEILVAVAASLVMTLAVATAGVALERTAVDAVDTGDTLQREPPRFLPNATT